MSCATAFPDEKPLRDGDILNIDVTLIVDGWHGDASRMFAAGEPPRRAQRLIDVTYEAMMRGIAAVKPGGTTGDIGYAIQTYAESERCSVVRDFCGHGLGRLFHDAPNILHFGRQGEGAPLKPGHVLHHRADDQSRRLRGEDAVGRLDGGDARPVAVGAVRAHGRRHRDRLRDLHPVARPDADRAPVQMTSKADEDEPAALSRPSRAPARARLLEAGAAALADYELLELILFRPIPRATSSRWRRR